MVVNCLQPHPTICTLATSGIDNVIRIWSPLAEGATNKRQVINLNEASFANQRRMRLNPLEAMLMNSALRGGASSSDDDDSDSDGGVQCRPS
ncbi:WD and tetratricopeptide repeats protein 1 [Halotydeus destructor]|nr:WD and tetratricopeptide repeats protein 1 [Halotydeus destructor]